MLSSQHRFVADITNNSIPSACKEMMLSSRSWSRCVRVIMMSWQIRGSSVGSKQLGYQITGKGGNFSCGFMTGFPHPRPHNIVIFSFQNIGLHGFPGTRNKRTALRVNINLTSSISSLYSLQGYVVYIIHIRRVHVCVFLKTSNITTQRNIMHI